MIILKEIINLVLLTLFILAILNLIKTFFQYLPIIKKGLVYQPSDKELILFGLSIAYTLSYIIKGFGI